MNWNWWPWQKTEREQGLLQEVEKLKAHLELSLLREEGLAFSNEQLRLQMIRNAAVAKQEVLATGIPEHLIDQFAASMASRRTA